MPSAPVEYYPTPDSAPWIVENIEWLESEFGVKPATLPAFHAIAAQFSRGWEICRRVGGINPQLLSVDTDAKYLRCQKKLEVAIDMGINSDQYESEIEAVRTSWLMWCRQKEAKGDELLPDPNFKPLPKPAEKRSGRPPGAKNKKAAAAPPPPPPVNHAELPPVDIPVQEPQPARRGKSSPPPEPPLKLLDLPEMSDPSQAELLRRYGFHDMMFASNPTIGEADAERAWVIGKITDYQRLLDEPSVSTMVQHAIVNELLLNRINRQMLATPVTYLRFADLQEVKKQIEDNYQDAWEGINKICPWADQVTNRVNQAGVISDFIRAIQDYKVKKSNDRIFGLRNSFGMQIVLREAVQHDIRWRPGQDAAMAQAMQPDALWDPNWKRALPDYACKLMDETAKEIARRMREESNIPLPDLESDHPKAGEYPPLYEPKEETEATVEPAENVPMGE